MAAGISLKRLFLGDINSSDLKNFTLSAKEILEIKGMAAGLLVAAETLSVFC